MGKVGVQSPDDVVVVAAYRTAITKARKGNFRDTTPDDLLASVLSAVMDKSGTPREAVGDIKVGNVQLGGAFAGGARVAQLRAGFPVDVPIMAVNRQCSSGLTAVADIAAQIRSGLIDAGIGAGVESMTLGGGVTKGAKREPPPFNMAAVKASKLEADSVFVSMGQTSENVASRYGVTREMQDQMAAASHQKALDAQAKGYYHEIIPVTTTVKLQDGTSQTVVVDKDEGPRAGSSAEKLSKLKPAFVENGTTTAGNASQVSDGAGAVLLMRRARAQELGVPVIGAFRGFSSVGVQPDEMGVGPAAAIPAVLQQAHLNTSDIDIYEINEAFASQAVYSVNKLGIDMAKVNPKGGAIALGHPLGATGARQVGTLLSELHRTGKKLGVVSMCIGTGMGAAAVFEAEGPKYQ